MGKQEDLKPEDPQQVGHYKIVARLGSGGMGQVYLARSPGGRPVAVKVVRPELAGDNQFRRRFKREVAAAKRVNGHFTAGVVAADPDGSPAWLATAYVPGPSLSEALTAHGPWPLSPVLALAAGLVEALEDVHTAGVIHRDLKPSNVLLAADGPRIIDFGISVALESSALTQTGMMIGTPGYMSPEQILGKPVSTASDVFALGAVLTHTANGVGPFGVGSPAALCYRTVHEEPDLDLLPVELRRFVSDCLAKEPDQRPSLATLLNRLTHLCGTDGPTVLLTEPDWMPGPVAQLVQQSEHPTPLPKQAAEPTGRQTRGTVLWTFGCAEPGFWRSLIHEDLRPAVAAGLVYITCGVPQLYAVDATSGTQRWSFIAGGQVWSPPAVSEGVVYFGSDDSKMYAVDAMSGAQKWSFATGKKVRSSPTVSDGVLYFGSYDGKLYAVDRTTGQKRWSFRTNAYVRSSPKVANGIVYFGSDRISKTFDVDVPPKLFAIDAVTGHERWSFTIGWSRVLSPTVADGIVYAIGTSDDPLYALQADTGLQRWACTIGPGHSAPLVADGTVYVLNLYNRLVAVQA